MNGAICFDISENGYIVGTSSLNQGAGQPFIWDSVNGMQGIPLPPGTSSAIARGVNSAGQVVGIGSSAFAIPFLFDGGATYRLQDLLPPGSGWNLATNTSSSALGISEGGIIVGTGIHNGATHAYAMIPTPPVATLLAQFVATGNQDGIALRWSFSTGSDWTSVTVERAPGEGGPWQPLIATIDVSDGTMTTTDDRVQPGETRWYRLRVVDRADESSTLGLVSATRGMPGAGSVVLGAVSPNPASRGAAVAFRLGAAQDISLSVLDVRGRRVRALFEGRETAGEHLIHWDGAMDDGVPTAPGVYYFGLRTSGGNYSQRVVVVR
jgi:uncharacterized membrane protein